MEAERKELFMAPTCLALISPMLFFILQSGDVKAQETIKQLLDNPPQERIEAFENFANTHENGYTETGSTPNGEYKIIMKTEGFKRFCFSFTDKKGIEGSIYFYLENKNGGTEVRLYDSPSYNFPEVKENLNHIVKDFVNGQTDIPRNEQEIRLQHLLKEGQSYNKKFNTRIKIVLDSTSTQTSQNIPTGSSSNGHKVLIEERNRWKGPVKNKNNI